MCGRGWFSSKVGVAEDSGSGGAWGMRGGGCVSAIGRDDCVGVMGVSFIECDGVC